MRPLRNTAFDGAPAAMTDLVAVRVSSTVSRETTTANTRQTGSRVILQTAVNIICLIGDKIADPLAERPAVTVEAAEIAIKGGLGDPRCFRPRPAMVRIL